MSYCIGVNRTGKDGDGYAYNGHTAAYDALGQNITELNLEKPFVKQITLDKGHIDETRGKFKFLQDRDDFILK